MFGQLVVAIGIEAARIAITAHAVDNLSKKREGKTRDEIYKEMHEYWFNAGWKGAENAYKKEANMYKYLYYKSIGREDLIKAYGLDKDF